MEKEIQSLLTELFDLIGIKVQTNISKEGDVYKVEIDPGESAGLLIGSHGMTLSSIQSFLVIALKQKTGDWVTVSVDIAHWGEKQSARLSDLANSVSSRVKQTGEEQKLYNLNPSERRIVHLALSQDGEIETFSEGEGRDRYLVVRLKK